MADALFDAPAEEPRIAALRRLREGGSVQTKEETVLIAHGLAYKHVADGTLRLTPHGSETLERADDPD